MLSNLLLKASIWARARDLDGQLNHLEKQIKGLSPKYRIRLAEAWKIELTQARRMPFPHLYQVSGDIRYRLANDAMDTALLRTKSSNPEVKLRGLCLWLTLAYLETVNSPHSQQQAVQRRLVSLFRKLGGKENSRRKNQSWFEQARSPAT